MEYQRELEFSVVGVESGNGGGVLKDEVIKVSKSQIMKNFMYLLRNVDFIVNVLRVY